ncbi:MAG: transposase [Herminiimonas sp.]|jgi:transposase|nr:transposase [Herminiimonas sp.]MDB5852563.1 transposase [Herminiimonas sp.]
MKPMKPTKKSTTSKAAPTAKNPDRVRTTFSKEFKLQAVELLELGQKNPTELAMELGVRRNQLYKWRDQLKAHGAENAFRGPGRLPEEQQGEVERLKRELKRVTEERDILKKFTAYFGSHLP